MCCDNKELLSELLNNSLASPERSEKNSLFQYLLFVKHETSLSQVVVGRSGFTLMSIVKLDFCEN